MSEFAPTSIIIDGAADRLARILVRQAAERDDVEITAVVGDFRAGESMGRQYSPAESFRYQLQHDSVYGRSDVEVIYHATADDVERHDKEVIVCLGRSFEDVVLAHGRESRLPERLVLANLHTWEPGRDIERPLAFTNDQSLIDHYDRQPLFVPGARLLAALPILAREELELSYARIHEMSAWTDRNVLTDKGWPKDAERLLSESRGAAQAMVVTDPQEAWGPATVDYGGRIERSRQLQKQTLLFESCVTVPVAVGALAIVGLDGDGFMSRGAIRSGLRHAVDELPETHQWDSLTSTIDTKQSPMVHVTQPEQPGGATHLELRYDSQWLQARHILDAARLLGVS